MEQETNIVKRKIPCAETGIEVKQTICDICCPSFHCGIDAYIKDGKVIKIEGTNQHPINKGLLCTKGLANRQYIYREDRIKTPLKCIGERGSGEFKAISWEEAYKEIGEKLNKIKAEDGAESVVFFSGYSKWYRPYLHRFLHSFGSLNYATESSSCMTSTFLNWLITTGNEMCTPDTANAGVYLGWAFNPYHSRYLAAFGAENGKKRGMKVIIIDPRITHASEKLADIHLRPRSGTDGALALGFAYQLIKNNKIDLEYINKYVYGYAEFKEYVQEFTAERVEELTGIPCLQIIEAAQAAANPLSLVMLIIPATIIVLCLMRKHLITALSWGIIVGIITGLASGIYTINTLHSFPGGFKVTGLIFDAINGCLGTIAMLIAVFALLGVMEASGIFEDVGEFLSSFAKTQTTTEITIVGAVGALSMITGVISVAIVAMGSLVKDLGETNGVDKYRRSNLMDCAGCVFCFLSPWTVHCVIPAMQASSFATVAPASIPFVNFYALAMLGILIFSIITGYGREKTK